MHLLLAFVYPVAPKPSLTLRTAARLATLADKYDTAAVCAPHIAEVFSTTYRTFSDEPISGGYVMAWLEHADKLGSSALVDRCIDFLDSNARKLAWGPAADKALLARLSSATLAELLVRGVRS
jgi:hypothetical protein